MPPALVDVLAVAALVVLLAVAFVHPPGWVEVLVGRGGRRRRARWSAPWTRPARVDQTRLLFPVVAFLAAILVVAEVCAAEGVFAAVGSLVGPGQPAAARGGCCC